MSSNPLWRTPPDDFMLPEDQVHVWRARLNLPEAEVEGLRAFLTEEELRKANRFHFPEHRRHFTVARGTLRRLLGGYLGESPGDIRFLYNPYGKPFLDTSLRFNLSHSGEMALYAFTHNREVGIDIEWVRRGIEDGEQIAKRFFSPGEVETFLGLPAPLRKTAFFNGWTRKEAYIKARGKGLSIPLDQFEVTLAPGSAARLLATRDDPQNATRWMMRALAPGEDYIATLVVEGPPCEIRYWTEPATATN
uniref:4'-phosphopantetheinyl transferase n=1 Tax=Candidatus Kentrum eta TaxID=2126337 RepID=A0A450V0D2_9GAMM|nr:MAG: 4'-phosphopantetheinyl transferase [Candidatus Kentron sp. H]VFJ98175.1 MAG: 4'-phosphopantetheinyl transferase [Candidatus Kentron sp. H]VFK03229.1 MAG: 4'-phosphopantetheinyl transferase [Candidatus Kentron sp. H]